MAERPSEALVRLRVLRAARYRCEVRGASGAPCGQPAGSTVYIGADIVASCLAHRQNGAEGGARASR